MTRPCAAAVFSVAMIAASCHCRPGGLDPIDSHLVVTPSPVVLPDTYVGFDSTATVEVANQGGASASIAISIGAPFTCDATHLDVAGHSSSQLLVHFAPTTPGKAEAPLQVGGLMIDVKANALATPACTAPACNSAVFDPDAGACLTAQLPDGTACISSCLTGGICISGACEGNAQSCDDGDACTVDGCGAGGACSHQARVCPQDTTHCLAPTCDPASGCGTLVATDGTLCGDDDCLSNTVQVCISGQCVSRPRAAAGRCANTWVPVTLPPRTSFGVVYDGALQRTVLFGGELQFEHASLSDTWQWDGTQWASKLPATSPPARFAAAMAYDPIRQRVVLFGGRVQPYGAFLSDTWEWDGVTWVQRSPAHSPPARAWPALATDTTRHRLVLYGGGDDSTSFVDTWEWDGLDWQQRSTAHSPGERGFHAMAFDATRGRTVLVGGGGAGTWEWDGTDWFEASSATEPVDRYFPGLAWDSTRQRVQLFGGLDSGHAKNNLWEWDGANWSQRTVSNPPPASDECRFAYDDARQRLVLLSALDPETLQTWELDGQSWVQTVGPSPVGRASAALAFDDTRHRLLLFGGYTSGQFWLSDTWEWDGNVWQQRTTEVGPSPRSSAALAIDGSGTGLLFGGNDGLNTLSDSWSWNGAWSLASNIGPTPRDTAIAYDALHGETVLFGGDLGSGTTAGDTWTFDGGWHSLSPVTSPSARHTPLAYDAARQRVVLFGGATDSAGVVGETWTWDGTNWSQLSPATAPNARRYHALAYDPDRQLVVLFGGEDTVASTLLADTWEWDGGSWLQRQPAVSPPPTNLHSMAYDGVRHHVVLLGDVGMWEFLP